MKHSHTSFVEEIEQHTTDTNEVAAPNDVQDKTDNVLYNSYTLLWKGVQLMLLLYHKGKMMKVSSIKQNLQTYHNYSRCCL